MNIVNLAGRLLNEPIIKYSKSGYCVAKYTLNIRRQGKQSEFDNINCTAIGRNGEFVERYLHKGMRIGITGHVQPGQYKNASGRTFYSITIVADQHEFLEDKGSQGAQNETDPFCDAFDEVYLDQLFQFFYEGGKEEIDKEIFSETGRAAYFG